MKYSKGRLVIVLSGLLALFCGLSTSLDCKTAGICDESPWNLVFLEESAVRYVNVSRNSDIHYIFQNDEHRPNSVTTNVRDNLAFWTDIDANGIPVIYSSSLSSTSVTAPEIFVDVGIYDPRGLAYDWISDNVYFVDYKLTTGQIIVCSTKKPTRCAVMFHEESGQPYDISLDPNEGLMFWTVNGQAPSIKRALMDGSEVTSVVTTDVQLPQKICVDGTRIFWTDVKKEVIESAKYDGSDRLVLVKSIITHAIGILNNTLIWFDYNGSMLKTADKLHGPNDSRSMPEFEMAGLSMDIKDISIMDITRQPISRKDSCKGKGCSHICVLTGPDDARCICPVGMIINGASCQVDYDRPKLFVAQKRTLLTTQVDIIGTDVFQKLPLPFAVKSIDALVYNPLSQSVIIYDGITKKIFNYKQRINMLEVLVDKNLYNVVSMDLDLISHNLFWLDAGKNEVEIFSLKSRTRRVIYKNVENAHQVVSDLGNIYVAKTGSRGIQEIHLVSMHPPTSDHLVKTFGAEFLPVQMTHDKSTTMLVIASNNGSHITIQSEYSAYRKDIAFTLTINGGSVEALAKIGNRVYWLDQSNKVKVLNPGDILDGKYLVEKITINNDKIDNNTRKLISVYPGSDYLDKLMENLDNNVCSYNQNHCPEICIPNADKGGRCLCTNGYEISDNFDYEHGKCVKTNSTEEVSDYWDTIVDASDFVGDIIDGESKRGTSGLIWGYLVLSFVIVLLGCVIGYMGWRWRKTRSIPLIIKPFFRNEEEMMMGE